MVESLATSFLRDFVGRGGSLVGCVVGVGAAVRARWPLHMPEPTQPQCTDLLCPRPLASRVGTAQSRCELFESSDQSRDGIINQTPQRLPRTQVAIRYIRNAAPPGPTTLGRSPSRRETSKPCKFSRFAILTGKSSTKQRTININRKFSGKHPSAAGFLLALLRLRKEWTDRHHPRQTQLRAKCTRARQARS